MLQYDLAAALAHLRAVEPRFGVVIDRVGPPDLGSTRPRAASPFESLARAIVYQQLSGKAAATIYGRLRAQLSPGPLRPAEIATLDADAYRQAGVSRAKERALRDLAAHVLDGTVPSWEGLAPLSDEEIVRRCTQVWGVGVWTVQMLLLFDLGRPDVLPTADLGVRRGCGRLLGLEAPPTPAALVGHAAPWRPFRSVASWYLWRVADAP